MRRFEKGSMHGPDNQGTAMQTVETVKPRTVFVVVMREVLVAQDIEAILMDAAPEASVILAPTLEEAEAGLLKRKEVRVAAAFVELDPVVVSGSTLGQRVAADGGRLVLLASESTDTLPQGWTGLPFPFAEADVTAQLSGGHPMPEEDGEVTERVSPQH
jgi:hypothetical protein